MKSITWAGGTHAFNLSHKWVVQSLAIRGLPGQFGNTPAACLQRFERGVYSPNDIERVFELGLIGGGLSQSEAVSLVANHVRGQPMAGNAVIAFELLASLFVGTEDK